MARGLNAWAWGAVTPWAELRARREPLRLEAPADRLVGIAADLGLPELQRLEADLRLQPLGEGVSLTGELRAAVVQECGVSLELFEAEVTGPIDLRLEPACAAGEAEREVVVSLEGDDPPEAVAGPGVDLSHYLVEALALTLDPWPRKPGAQFDPLPDEDEPQGPFAALAALRTGGEAE